MNYKTALITGGSSGIGAAITKALRQRELEVHVVALPDESLDDIAQQTGAVTHGIDVDDVTALAAVIEKLDVDVLVNNVGIIGELVPFQNMACQTIDNIVDINLRCALHATHLILPKMLQHNRGHIFFTGSMAGKYPTPNTAVYGATKAALHAFAEGLRIDVLGSAVRVTALVPGRVETHIYDSALGGHERAQDKLYTDFASVQPDDVASAVLSALDMPPHVDMTVLEINPTMQVFGGSQVAKSKN